MRENSDSRKDEMKMTHSPSLSDTDGFLGTWDIQC